MKRIMIAMMVCFCAATVTKAQQPTSTRQKAENPVAHLLTLYYAVKDALVSSKSTEASTQAKALADAIKSTDATALSTKEKAKFAALQESLAQDAGKIAASTKLDNQREHFSKLSLNMWELVKASDMEVPAYEQYCPMKKTYWISNEAAIKNPYYGKQMLTCGKVVETTP